MMMVVVACSSERLHLTYRYIRSKTRSCRKDSKARVSEVLGLTLQVSQVVEYGNPLAPPA